jgi:hypothetical protein
MKTMKTALWIVALLGAVTGAIGAERPQDYAALAPVASSSPEGLQRVHLPLSLLQHSRSARLDDLRVFNAQGDSLAFAFVPARQEARTRDAALPMFVWPERAAGARSGRVQVQVDAAGAVVRIEGAAPAAPAEGAREWLLDASSHAEGERLSALSLQWARGTQALVRHATLEGSDDFIGWQSLGFAALVDLANEGDSVRQDRIAVDASRPLPKYLRLRVDQPLALRGVQAQWRSSAPPQLEKATLSLQRAGTEEPPAWALDLGAALPVRKLGIVLPRANSIAIVWLEQREEGSKAWRPLGRYTLYRLTRNAEELLVPPIEIDAAPARHWRLRLDAQSPALPAPVLSVELQWVPSVIVVAGRAPGPLQLALGREKSSPAALPLATLLPGYRDGDEARLPEAAVGVISTQTPAAPGFIDSLREAGPEQQRRWLLWAVLVVAVLGLAWLARGLLKDLSDKQAGP